MKMQQIEQLRKNLFEAIVELHRQAETNEERHPYLYKQLERLERFHEACCREYLWIEDKAPRSELIEAMSYAIELLSPPFCHDTISRERIAKAREILFVALEKEGVA